MHAVFALLLALVAAHQRVVTLVPSFADDLYAIGGGADVVGVSSYTDAAGARGVPRVADFVSIDAERIVALRPDAVVGIPSQARLVLPLQRAGIRVVLLRDDAYADIFEDIRALGELTGRQAQAAALVRRLQRETAQLQARARKLPRRPSVFVVLGVDPIWTAGSDSYIATLIQLAGGRNAAAGFRGPYGEYSAEALVRDRPDAIVTDPAVGLGAVLTREPWRSLTAVREAHVYAVTPAAILERPGPSYNEGIRWLLARLTPLAARP
ncbi:MAG TPA: helical backbone metal receptor [Candidatus Acidoferrales bacterium]|nr:helical backbone metal receptor [Candidatus Acidoferrales bacterium]